MWLGTWLGIHNTWESVGISGVDDGGGAGDVAGERVGR